MERIQNVFDQDSESVRLTPEEREAIFQNIRRHIEFIKTSSERKGVRQIFQLFRFRFMPGVFLAGILGIGGIAYAENSLPGDFLYPLKIHVNEEVLSGLSFTSKAHGDWEAQRVTRRLEEAETLVARSALDMNTKDELVKTLNAQLQNVQNDAQKLSMNGDGNTASMLLSRLETTLEVHKNVLEKVGESLPSENQEQNEPVMNMLQSIEDAKEATAVSRLAIEDQMDVDEEARLFQGVQKEIADAERELKDLERALVYGWLDVPPRLFAEAINQASVASGALMNAKRELSEGNVQDAQTLVRTSKRNMDEVTLLLKIQDTLQKAGKERSAPSSGSGSPVSSQSTVSSLASSSVLPSFLEQLMYQAQNEYNEAVFTLSGSLLDYSDKDFSSMESELGQAKDFLEEGILHLKEGREEEARKAFVGSFIHSRTAAHMILSAKTKTGSALALPEGSVQSSSQNKSI